MSMSDTLRRAIAANPGLGLDALMPHVPEAESRDQLAKLLSALSSRGEVARAGEPRAYTYTITEAGAARNDDDPEGDSAPARDRPARTIVRKPAAKTATRRPKKRTARPPKPARKPAATKRSGATRTKRTATAPTSSTRRNGHDQAVSNAGANQRQVAGDHYRRLDPQPWDVIQAWGLGFLAGNVVKYVARAPAKGGIEDLQKARHYLDKLIETAAA